MRPARRGAARRLGLIAAAVLAGSGLGLAIDVARAGGLGAWLASRNPTLPAPPQYEAKGRLMSVGGGRSIYLDCRGSGAPTVILETGLGGGADGWGSLFERIAGLTRVCAWDRPGIGRSPSRGLHTGLDTAQDLRAALDAADEDGPFVVVAHSLGGMYARLFASATGDAVRAFVMIDIYEPDLGMDADPALTPATRAMIRQNLDAGGDSIAQAEQLDWARTMSQLEARTLQPAALLFVDQHQRYVDADPAVTAALVAAWERAFHAHYPNGLLEIVPNAGHFIQFDQPDLVLDRIRQVLAEQRAPGRSTGPSPT
jgi:pimeloyl-ACP methyl ester carboxylesterase